MSEEHTETKKEKEKLNISLGGALLYITMIIPWVFGVALSKESIINAVFAFIFPPYAWIITSSWIIELINKSFNP